MMLIALLVRLTAALWFLYIASRYIPAAAVLLSKQRLFITGLVMLAFSSEKKWNKANVPDAVRHVFMIIKILS